MLHFISCYVVFHTYLCSFEGGFVHITCHKRMSDGTTESIISPNEIPSGGIAIDDAFYTFLCEICGPQLMENFKSVELEDYFDLFQDFERKKRSTPWKQNSEFVVSLPVSLIDMMLKTGKGFDRAIEKSPHKGNVKYGNGKLIISLKTIKGLFDQTINILIKHITNMQKDPKVSDINMIIMVGGFSECELVQEAISDTLGKSISLIMSDEAGQDTMKGAVLYGFQPNVSSFIVVFGLKLPKKILK